jgi:diguanylate cyclase (GGDEF)-like protein
LSYLARDSDAGEEPEPAGDGAQPSGGEQEVRARRFEAFEEARGQPLLLLVDDDPDGREALSDLLSQRFAVVSAADGEEAIELARDRAPDLIVMDIVMPRLSGVGAFEALLKDPRTAEIPVIFLSAHDDEGTTALCLNRGAADYVTKPASGRELFARIDRALHQARERRALQAMAQTDALTGLANFRALRARLGQEIRRAARYRYPLSAVMIDMDNLKLLNDRFGHDAGNRVIVALARHLRDNLRETDFAARFGGDEFVVLLPHQTAQDAAVFAERIRAGVQELHFRGDSDSAADEVQLSVSVGVACRTPMDIAGTGQDLLQAADATLYRAKRGGRNRVLIDDEQVTNPFKKA